MEYPYYRSEWEAYPYLAEAGDDLRCDYEMETDEIASYIGLLRAEVLETALPDPIKSTLVKQLSLVNGYVYHLNPSLRLGVKVTAAERDKLLAMTEAMQERAGNRGFVLPEGKPAAALAHVVRCRCKKLVRLTYRYLEQEGCKEFSEDDLRILIDVPNLLSGYFFGMALWLNKLEGMTETPFESRHYKI